MSKSRLFLLVTVWSCVFVLWGCGKKFKYHFTENFNGNKCDTGEQSFGSLEEMCEAIQIDSKNDSCAFKAREDYFKSSSCPGTFTRR